MSRTGSIAVTAAVVLMQAATGLAQTAEVPAVPAVPATADAQAAGPGSPATQAARTLDRSELRHQIYVMEGALSRAVAFGAQRLNREIRSVMPEMVALSGEPQARGVYLDGFGVFFDVGVPVLHQSMFWSLRSMLGQDPRGLSEALNTLKQNAKTLEGPNRAAAENAIARIELQLGPIPDPADTGVAQGPQRPNGLTVPVASGQSQIPPAAAGQDPQASPTPWLDKKYLQDPNALNRAYTEAVQRAVIDAMIDYSLPMAIAPEEYLTVAARDNMQRDALAPPDPFEEVVTIMYRLKGADLAAYRSRQIDKDELRKRVQVREF